MKQINFIKTVTKDEQIRLKKWYSLCIIVIGSSLCLMACTSGIQAVRWYRIRQNYYALVHHTNSTRTQTQPYHELCQAQQKLQEKHMRYQRIAQKLPSLDSYLVALQTACAGASLRTYSMQKEHATLTFASTTSSHAYTCLHKLKASNLWQQIELVSLQSDPQAGSFVATAKCIYKTA